jgi:hypothetical protein
MVLSQTRWCERKRTLNTSTPPTAGLLQDREKAGVQRAQPFAGARGTLSGGQVTLAFPPFLAAEGGKRGLLNRPGSLARAFDVVKGG